MIDRALAPLKAHRITDHETGGYTIYVVCPPEITLAAVRKYIARRLRGVAVDDMSFMWEGRELIAAEWMG